MKLSPSKEKATELAKKIKNHSKKYEIYRRKNTQKPK